MGTYVALLLAVGALAAVLYYFFGSKKSAEEPAATTESRGESGGLIHVVARTDPGLKRKHNEDSFLVVQEHALFVVADGMGRHAAGEVASKLAVEKVSEYFQGNNLPKEGADDLPPEGLLVRDAVLAANKAVFQQATEVDEYHGMGTTIVVLHFTPKRERAIIGSAGDSRCYRLRGGELKQLTTDHTLGAAGIVGSNAALLSRAVGIEENLEVDVLVDAPLPDDLYMLCSDGLSRMVDHDGLLRVLNDLDKSLDDRAHKLIEEANQAGGRDNVTVILVQVARGKVG
jgi:protein phosphatase